MKVVPEVLFSKQVLLELEAKHGDLTKGDLRPHRWK